MITETTQLEIPVSQARIGLKAAAAVAAFLAAISIAIFLLRDQALEIPTSDPATSVGRLDDYALRHTPGVVVSDRGTSVDYALRHVDDWR